MNSITLRQLKIFSLIVEQGSFARCADFLGISSVAISDHVRKLESRLGHQLFERHKGTVSVLTAEGARDYKRVLTILSEVALLESTHDNEEGKIAHRTLRIGADPFIFESMREGVDIIKSTHSYIDLDFKLNIISRSDIEKQLHEHKIDVGYFYASEGTYHNLSTFVCDEPLAIYVGASHPLISKPFVSIDDLSQTPSIQGSENNYLCQLVNNALEQAGLSDYPIGLESDHFGLMLSSLHENKGFQCMLKRTEIITPYTEKLVRLKLNFSIPHLQIRQIIHPSFKYDPFVNDAVNVLNKLTA